MRCFVQMAPRSLLNANHLGGRNCMRCGLPSRLILSSCFSSRCFLQATGSIPGVGPFCILPSSQLMLGRPQSSMTTMLPSSIFEHALSTIWCIGLRKSSDQSPSGFYSTGKTSPDGFVRFQDGRCCLSWFSWFTYGVIFIKGQQIPYPVADVVKQSIQRQNLYEDKHPH